MELFIIRHATAEERREGKDDAARKLTKAGREKWRHAVGGLDALGVRFDRLYHSPWTRAVETADEAEALIDGDRVMTERLAAEPGPELLAELTGDCVAVVGHEPWLGQLVAWLITSKTDAAERFLMKKGGVAWLEGEPRPGKMTLKALLPPKVLRGLR